MSDKTKTFSTRIKSKRDTSANWESANPVLLNGEKIIVDTSAGEVREKIGDGVKTYSQLPFTDEKIRGLITEKADEVELERLKYYGDKDIVPSSENYFTVNSTGETITGLTDTGKTQTELVIPYKINGVKITTLFSGSDGSSGPPMSILNGNSRITKVVIPKSVTTLGIGAFFNCSSLRSVNIPNSVTSIGAFAFYGGSSLTSINIPNNVISIGDYVFYGCSSLTKIEIPNSVTSIGEGAFQGCRALTSIEIPDSVTSIGTGAFQYCRALTSIEIGNSVTSIEYYSFDSCPNLTIYCEQGSTADTYAKANDIPVVYTAVKDGLIGKKGINDSSEMFNDINNNIAGSKVFTITAVNDKELTVDLSSLTAEELSTFNSIQAGARCCVDTSTEQDNIKIVSVDGANGKIVVENTVSALEVEDGTIDSDPTHRNYILILDYPNLGNTYDKTINTHAEGENTQALARGSHSEGRYSKAIGQYAHSEGLGTISGYASHAEGRYTKATGNMSHAEGHLTNAYGHNSHSEGRDTTATGYASHAEGNMTEASGAHAHAEGIKTKASGETSHAEGNTTEASGAFSHSEGRDTIAQGDYSHVEGIGAKALNKYAHAEGANTQAKGEVSHAEGGASIAEGYISHAEGDHTTASGSRSHAEGNNTIALGAYSHAEGNNTKATGVASHVEGNQTEAGLQAHAEGDQTKATGETAHAEGRLTEASGASSHGEGKNTKATGDRAHAEGMNTKSTNESTHSEGIDTEANGRASHSEGTGTVANGENQHTQGKYNVKDTENKYAHIIGNGTSDTARSNAHTVDWNGNGWFAGDVEGAKDGVTHKLSEKVSFGDNYNTVDGNSDVPITLHGITEGLSISKPLGIELNPGSLRGSSASITVGCDTDRTNYLTMSYSQLAMFSGGAHCASITPDDVYSNGHYLSNKSEAKTYTVSVPTTSWTEKTDTDNQKYYYKKITVSGMTASGQAMTDVAMSDSVATARKEMEAYQCVNRVVTGNGYVELYCFEEVPTTAFTLRILVISNILS